jgi:hypothetical protein
VATGYPQVRLIGICFGHQIIASALGGECVPNDGTWEIGVTDVILSPTGKGIFGGDKIVSQELILSVPRLMVIRQYNNFTETMLQSSQKISFCLARRLLAQIKGCFCLTLVG